MKSCSLSMALDIGEAEYERFEIHQQVSSSGHQTLVCCRKIENAAPKPIRYTNGVPYYLFASFVQQTMYTSHTKATRNRLGAPFDFESTLPPTQQQGMVVDGFRH